MNANMNINVTQPFLPPIEDYEALVREIWSRRWLTNHGPLVSKLETDVAAKLGVDDMLYVSNGTIAIQLAIKALGLGGEIITTPFSYVATTSTICWEGCTPVMADISPRDFNIDVEKIEAAITDKTSAILATHVYGNPCDVVRIEEIASRHGLKVIYDAAHAFGVTYKGKSIYSFGDISTASFHATKIFHTIEGGGVFVKDEAVREKLLGMRNFGHTSPTSFREIGINGKNSEFHAAMGICNLRYIDEILQRRRVQSEHYDSLLDGRNIIRPQVLPDAVPNRSYYPVVFESEDILLRVVEQLNLRGVFPRRYFYPSLASLPYMERKYDVPVADDIAKRVLCLPLYHALSHEEIELICRIVVENA